MKYLKEIGSLEQSCAVICCADGRLHGEDNEFHKWQGKIKPYLISIPGASKSFMSRNIAIIEHNIEHIAIFVKHSSDEEPVVYIVHHSLCKAYEDFGFDSLEQEKEVQTRDMRKAKNIIQNRFPKVKKVVLLWYDTEGGFFEVI